MAKTATVYGFVGATRWRRIIEYRDKRIAELHGDRANGNDEANAVLEAWLLINGFTHYRFGPQGRKHTL